MNKDKIIYLIAGLVLGFGGGFMLSNSINRGGQDELRAELARLRASQPGTGKADGRGGSTADLDPKEVAERVRAAVAKADASPDDLKLQRDYGRGTYLYAMQTGDIPVLRDAARLLRRAHEADPEDYDTTVLLGNALFDIAQNSDGGDFKEARAVYEKALRLKPDDVNVRTDLGNTYFYDRPSDPQGAIREYRKSLVVNPRHEMSLQALAGALVAAGSLEEAERRLGELEKINPGNRALPDLRAQLAQRQNAAKEGK